MLWAHTKIVLSLTIPLSTIVYARQIRLDRDRRAIQQIISQPLARSSCASNTNATIERYRSEMQSLRRLSSDLDS